MYMVKWEVYVIQSSNNIDSLGFTLMRLVMKKICVKLGKIPTNIYSFWQI